MQENILEKKSGKEEGKEMEGETKDRMQQGVGIIFFLPDFSFLLNYFVLSTNIYGVPRRTQTGLDTGGPA